MNKKGKTLLIGLVIGLAIGCATTAVVKPLIIPKAHANVTQHLEHFCFSKNEGCKFERLKTAFAKYEKDGEWSRRILKKVETKGWELVGLMNSHGGTYGMCFKRPAKR